MTSLNIGQKAPDFTLNDEAGKPVALKDFLGKSVVLYFYPKDDTPGCTIEAKEFTEAAANFANKGAVVLGVSFDDAACHRDFIDKYNLKIKLLTDDHGKVAALYDSFGEKYPQRNTFLIGPDGVLKEIFRGVKPQGHAAAVLEKI